MAKPSAKFFFEAYSSESQLLEAIPLIQKNLPEPYTLLSYRSVVTSAPEACFFAYDKETKECVGVVLSTFETKRFEETPLSAVGHIGILVVEKSYRRCKLATLLMKKSMEQLYEKYGVNEVILETETSNTAALKLYESIGFFRIKFYRHRYLCGSDAFLMKLFDLKSALYAYDQMLL